jgi:hypothetical protein
MFGPFRRILHNHGHEGPASTIGLALPDVPGLPGLTATLGVGAELVVAHLHDAGCRWLPARG